MSDYYNKKYFVWQKQVGEMGGKINLSKFEKYIKKSDTVLDFGCGGGYLLKNINCKDKIGIDSNVEAIKECRKNGINKVFVDLFDVKSDSINVIISNHALEHVEQPIEILKQFYRILKTSSVLVLVLPYDDCRNTKKYNNADVNMHLYTWNTQLIGNCLKLAGFKDINPKIYTHAWPKYYRFLYGKLPRNIFDIVCYFTALKNNRRQIIALAKK